MNCLRWISYCVIVGLMALGVSTSAVAQFGGGARPKHERSPLVAAWASEGAIARDFCRCVGAEESPAVARIEQALRSPLRSPGLEFIDTPLEEVVNLLSEDYGILIHLDLTELDEIGLGPDEKVTISVHNISLRSALRLMLKQLGLTYMIQDEVLLITTLEEAEYRLVICVYDVRGVLDKVTDKSIKGLIDAITSCVAHDTWACAGGTGEIREIDGLLIVTQTRSVHEEISGLLATIRAMRGSEGEFLDPEPQIHVEPADE